jgi:ribose transport system substrate-binding protein
MTETSRFRLFANLSGVACLGLVAACGASDDSSSSQEKVTIGWLAKGASNNFFDLSRHAATLAAQDLASASGREVSVVLLDAEEATPEAQAARVDAAIDMRVDALAVSVLKPDVLTPVIDKASDAGIPVMTFDSDAPDSKRLTFYGISNLEGAHVAGDLLVELMGGQGKVAIMTAAGTQPGTLSTSQTYVERMNGFAEIVTAHPGVEVVSTTTCSATDEKEKAGCTAILEEVMAANPDITGWYLARGRVLREAGLGTMAPNWSARVLSGAMKVVAFDAPEDALHSVEDGLVHAIITQDYFGWGYDVVSLAFDAVTIGRQFEPFTDSRFDVVCSNNIGELRAMWSAKDFRGSLSPCNLASSAMQGSLKLGRPVVRMPAPTSPSRMR